MATLAISPIPHKFDSMPVRRVPLGDVPNAANSPARNVPSYKRSRDQTEAQEKLSFDVQPRAKRQALDAFQIKNRESPVKPRIQQKEDRVLAGAPTNEQPTAFERRLLAARDTVPQQRVQRQDKAPQETLESVRRWQKHYKQAFPQFVFYFEGIPEDVRSKCSRTVRNLGAREEKFFSKEVTHVITSRSIPSYEDSKDRFDLSMPSSLYATMNQARTINPVLLDRPTEVQGITTESKSSKGSLETSNSRRTIGSGLREMNQRKNAASGGDILLRAQELSMKVWHLEKLQRIMSTMFEVPSENQSCSASHTRDKANSTTTRVDRAADLSRMLRNERLHGPSDRDNSTKMSEVVPFKGPYIYIRDIDERTKAVMVREWGKPTKKGELGEWPQFRAVSHGKCPFVEETTREDMERELVQQEDIYVSRRKAQSRSELQSRAGTPTEVYEDEDEAVEKDKGHDLAAVQKASCGQPQQELKNLVDDCSHRSEKPTVPQFCPPPSKLPNQIRSPSKATNQVSTQGHSRAIGVEPAASGLQPSNITSAIRSQMISSTAAAPGVKSGTSKEVHGLKRKVLEKNAAPALNTIQARQHRVDPLANARAENHIAHARQLRRNARETLVQIHEESTQSEDEDVWLAEDVRTSRSTSKKGRKKDAKPGYCENCREKYEDFDGHIVGRKHRKFALTPENWKDLDRLLTRLTRPLKDVEPDGF